MQIINNEITVDKWLEIRRLAGFSSLDREIAQKALDGSYCTLSLKKGKECIGMLRITEDDANAYYINDLIIAPDYRGLGYGRLIVSNAIDFIRRHMDNEEASIHLISVPEASGFYEKLGFVKGL